MSSLASVHEYDYKPGQTSHLSYYHVFLLTQEYCTEVVFYFFFSKAFKLLFNSPFKTDLLTCSSIFAD